MLLVVLLTVLLEAVELLPAELLSGTEEVLSVELLTCVLLSVAVLDVLEFSVVVLVTVVLLSVGELAPAPPELSDEAGTVVELLETDVVLDVLVPVLPEPFELLPPLEQAVSVTATSTAAASVFSVCVLFIINLLI